MVGAQFLTRTSSWPPCHPGGRHYRPQFKRCNLQSSSIGSLVHMYSPPTSAVLESHDDVADVVQHVFKSRSCFLFLFDNIFQFKFNLSASNYAFVASALGFSLSLLFLC